MNRAILQVAQLARISTWLQWTKCDMALASCMRNHGQVTYSWLRKRGEISLTQVEVDGGRPGASRGPKNAQNFMHTPSVILAGGGPQIKTFRPHFPWVIQEMFLFGPGAAAARAALDRSRQKIFTCSFLPACASSPSTPLESPCLVRLGPWMPPQMLRLVLAPLGRPW